LLTNRCPSGLNRGFGGPQLYFALERTMDRAAKQLGVDPAELRRLNLVREFPYTTPSGGVYDSGDFEACLDDALELVRYDERRAEQAAGGAIGIGIACVVEPSVRTWGTSRLP
jgi:2-furoyl-CoA dehydrogenase large subunit